MLDNKILTILTLVASTVSWAQIDPNNAALLAKGIDCSTLTSRTEVFSGISYKKYNIVDPNLMKCTEIKSKQPVMSWKVKKDRWSLDDEAQFGTFLNQIGHSTCNTVDKCLSQQSNILRTTEDMLYTHYSDCADFPYYLRSYFAYKKNLPFVMVSEITQAPFTSEQLQNIQTEREKILAMKGPEEVVKYDQRLADLRYSRNGNIPKARIAVPSSTGVARDFGQLAPKIMDSISSGTLRMLTSPEGYPESDFYSPAVYGAYIRPGTVLYNVSGHVAIVYEVTSDGEVKFIDAHPDNSVSRGSFNPDFKLVRSAYGGNFKNFRPFQVVNPVYDTQGVIIKGNIVSAKDFQIQDFSTEQYMGTIKGSSSPVFQLTANNPKGADFYDWVKYRLSGGKYRLRPINEMQNEMQTLCQKAQERVNAVQSAFDNQIYKKPHPERLPENIFGASGEWESYSTPGSDLRLKLRILSIPELAKTWMSRYKSQDPLVSYAGANLKSDLISTYRSAVASCKITYKNSLGSPVTIGLETLINRIANVSYDPYACPEIRWGANTQDELKTCADDQTKREWHSLQQFLRNNLEKDTSAVHGYSLEDLARMNERKEVDNNNSSERFRISSKLEVL